MLYLLTLNILNFLLDNIYFEISSSSNQSYVYLLIACTCRPITQPFKVHVFKEVRLCAARSICTCRIYVLDAASSVHWIICSWLVFFLYVHQWSGQPSRENLRRPLKFTQGPIIGLHIMSSMAMTIEANCDSKI